uniref:Uncharacterized protein n=1 Tax=Meloidogyne incognita TaxID=6306 RepID=A0A914NGL2_MELIC
MQKDWTTQLLNEHKRDFERQYDENKARLSEISQTITTIGSSLSSLNLEVRFAETPPCDPICEGPGPKCSQCGGGSSCPDLCLKL